MPSSITSRPSATRRAREHLRGELDALAADAREQDLALHRLRLARRLARAARSAAQRELDQVLGLARASRARARQSCAAPSPSRGVERLGVALGIGARQLAASRPPRASASRSGAVSCALGGRDLVREQLREPRARHREGPRRRGRLAAGAPARARRRIHARDLRLGARGLRDAVREVAREQAEALVEHAEQQLVLASGSGGRRPGSRGPRARTIAATLRLERSGLARSARSSPRTSRRTASSWLASRRASARRAERAATGPRWARVRPERSGLVPFSECILHSKNDILDAP